jgi:MinD superfamily P-loop ATPase
VTQVKQSARLAAHQDGADLLLVDGPPGIGCPAIAAMSGADLALMVVEPSVSSVHDLRRILATARHFGVQAAICLNKADINPAQAAAIAHTGAAEGVPVIGRIPFDQGVVEALVQRRPVTEQGHGAAREALRGLWKTLRTSVP